MEINPKANSESTVGFLIHAVLVVKGNDTGQAVNNREINQNCSYNRQPCAGRNIFRRNCEY